MSFEQEIKEIARIINGLMRHHEENDPSIDKQLERVDAIFVDFNKKYPKLELARSKSIDQMHIHICIKEPDCKTLFDNTASKIRGITSLGINGFEEANISEADQFNQLANSIVEKFFLTFTLDIGTETLVCQHNKRIDKVEMLYELTSLTNPLTPQFQLIETYSEVGQDIEILTKCYQIGFMDTDDKVTYQWEDEFYPKMLE